ncbi:hemerythrin domain-containing protein [Microbispora sp. ATCC PTA-5024]|uniref:hemerythrin domain-containing protein n=1 Tax=Microbispora sp. ATCC PTA-5024 TaxID=316330 RepID=UPI0003DC06FA|nr:hemerythrin domain-containing protein [Microbispora sp. ATCC PTA-5024]ETK37216.1 hemerythrin [Microbispora sp. ATCC PTA-5024]
MSDHRPTTETTTDEADVVDLLLRQHALIRDLFDEVETGGDRAGAFRRLVRMLAVHETAEEEIVHPVARRVLDGGEDVIDERLAEEHEAKEMLDRLDQLGPDDPEFDKNLQVLRAAVLAHARSEERYEFTLLRALTNEAERRSMTLGVKAAEAMAPTRPHPGVESATANVLLGPPVAIMDRTRDLIRKAMGTDG